MTNTPQPPTGDAERWRCMNCLGYNNINEAACYDCGYEKGYLPDDIKKLIEADREAQREALIAEIEAKAPKDKIFKGGLDNGMSDQIHGYNVANAAWRAALHQLKDPERN